MKAVKSNYYKEVIFYISIAMFVIMRWLDIHFINKVLGAYLLLGLAAVTFIFVRHIYTMKDTKRQVKILILLPILFVLTQSLFVLFAAFCMSFTVFKYYERTNFNRIMKGVYGVVVFIMIFAIGYGTAIYNQVAQQYDEYEGYVMSPDKSYVLTYKAEELSAGSSRLTYYLEDVYLGLLRKESKIIETGFYATGSDIEWLSDEEIQIENNVYNINNGMSIE